jgi:hypothetical protein
MSGGIRCKSKGLGGSVFSTPFSLLEDTGMASEWFYQMMGRQAGPISSAELRNLAQRGIVKNDTPVRKAPDGASLLTGGGAAGRLAGVDGTAKRDGAETRSRIYLPYPRETKETTIVGLIPFVSMKEERIAEALTGDHHFEQAGFRALLK